MEDDNAEEEVSSDCLLFSPLNAFRPATNSSASFPAPGGHHLVIAVHYAGWVDKERGAED